MTNPLFLPELREMLAEQDHQQLGEFCTALHPARTAEFMDGLTADETWQVLQATDLATRVRIFGFLDREVQKAIVETSNRVEIGRLVAEMPPDDRVDLLNQTEPDVVAELLPLIPADERRDIQRLGAHPEETAGALMTTEYAKIGERKTVREALTELQRQAEELETIYYLYVVDDQGHLRGVVSARQLVSSLGRPDTAVGTLMESDVVSVRASDDQESVAQQVADYDLLAIPVVDKEHHLLGIITHDDVIDVVREEAAEDAYRLGAIEPLEEEYLQTHWFKLTCNRAPWLIFLMLAALLTAAALEHNTLQMQKITWLVFFIPLVISSGGNAGSQSATLIITALARGNVQLRDWWAVVRREIMMGLSLGVALALISCVATILFPEVDAEAALIVPCTVILVVVFGTLIGSMLPLIFRRLGLDPALMSTPFVAGIADIAGVVIYMRVAQVVLGAGFVSNG